MDPALAGLLSDALKIIGPAAITGIAAYKAAALQFKATLRQIREGNEFSARQHLFDYYKIRQKKFSDGYDNLLNSLGQILGVNTAALEGELDESTRAIVEAFDLQVRLYLGAAPFDAKLILRDMKAANLDTVAEFSDLEAKKDLLSGLEPGADYKSKTSTVHTLVEIYSALERCNQLLLERKMDALFRKYIDERA